MKYRSRLLEHLGIRREDLPQFPKEQLESLLAGLNADGIDVSSRSLPVACLVPAQGELNAEKVQRLAGELVDGWPQKWKPLLVSRDRVILDGHHRWAAARLISRSAKVPILQIDLNFRELLGYASNHSDLKRGVDENSQKYGV